MRLYSPDFPVRNQYVLAIFAVLIFIAVSLAACTPLRPINPDISSISPQASPTPEPPISTLTPSIATSPIPHQTHRIGVRVVHGDAEFYDRATGQTFTPRGNNYIRIAIQSEPCLEKGEFYHSTFNPGEYDHELAASALAEMRRNGYNIVRVFINPRCVMKADGGISETYVENMVRFLESAQFNDIYVLFATDAPPAAGYMERVPHYDLIDWPNRHYMTVEGVAEEGRYWQDLIRMLMESGAAMDHIFGFALRNEAFFIADIPPLSLSSGRVSTGNGQSYDLSSPEEKQRMMDEHLVFWMDQVRESIHQVDPTALVGVGFFVPQGPNPARIGSNWVIRTYPAIWNSKADFIDLHAYPGLELTLGQHMANFELGEYRLKPIILGEFGAFRFAFPTISQAAEGLLDWQIESCKYGFDGWLLWTWDSDEQTELWNGLSADGSIRDALAPARRPDPCTTGP